jgi:hypothetical protein
MAASLDAHDFNSDPRAVLHALKKFLRRAHAGHQADQSPGPVGCEVE